VKFDSDLFIYLPIIEEIRKTNPIHNSLKKYLGANLVKEVKGLSNENYKILKKLVKTLDNGKTSHYSFRINIVK
jgi:hypothetical protein